MAARRYRRATRKHVRIGSPYGQTPAVTEMRALTADDHPDAWQLLEHAFGGANSPEDWEVELALVEPSRFLGSFEDGQVVAVAGAFALEMTVPGGPRPVAGVTWVGVRPTHRRRGLVSGLLRRQLEDLRAAGEPVAALWASQGAIYQRFGYGPAAWDVQLAVPSGSAFTRPVPAGGMRMATPDPAVLGPVWDAARRTRTGWSARDERWWSYRLFDPESRRSGAAPLLSVLADGPAGVEGYALYATRQQWSSGTPSGEVHVREVVATNPEAYARLWRYLLDLDLMKEVRIGFVGPDEPLLQLLAEPRAAQGRLKDNIWVRLVDVPGALAGRCYAAPVDVVLEVVDAFCPWNTGLWRLTGGPDGATCTPTSDPADLTVPVADLGGAYLGGSSTLAARAAAGSVVERRPGALAQASTAFGWPGPLPYSPLVF
jgi:predicted acetyltransferase